MTNYRAFFNLLRVALGLDRTFGFCPSEQEWSQLYLTAQQQTLTGVLYHALDTLTEEQKPPQHITLNWVSQAETIRGLNLLLNNESARLTKLFESQGHHTAILKGQANARLYPDVLSRQPGDIDIYVDGGYERVTQMLLRLGLLDYEPKTTDLGKKDKATVSYHHIHLNVNEKGVSVEIHFRPSSGNHNPLTNRRIQKFLSQEIKETCMVQEGFRVPSIRFALIMQLSHIQRHFLSSGIGLRRICDYYYLLLNSSDNDRTQLASCLRKMGLRNTAGALMWVLQNVFHLDQSLIICKPDAFRGEWMLREMMEGGDMRHYVKINSSGVWKQFFYSKRRQIRLMRFDFREILWEELYYWSFILKTLPERIRRCSVSLSASK